MYVIVCLKVIIWWYFVLSIKVKSWFIFNVVKVSNEMEYNVSDVIIFEVNV